MSIPVFVLALLATPSPAPPDACRLLTADEIRAAQKAPVSESRPSLVRDQGFTVAGCFYALSPFDRSVSLTLVGGSGDALESRWEGIFHRSEEDAAREGGEEREKGVALPVERLGDEAFWVPSPTSGALYVRSGPRYFRLSVGGPGSAEDKASRCRRLARHVLRRLPPAAEPTASRRP